MLSILSATYKNRASSANSHGVRRGNFHATVWVPLPTIDYI